MSNRPLKNKKKVVVEEEHDPTQEHEIEYRPPGKTSKDIIVQIGVTVLICSFILAPMLVFVLSPSTPQAPTQQQQAQQQDDTDNQIKHYSEEVTKNPNDSAALANLAFYTTQKAMRLPPAPENENQRMTLLKEAEGNFRKALEKDNAYGFAQAELARNLIFQKNYSEANAFIEQAMKTADTKIAGEDKNAATEAQSRKVQLLVLAAGLVAEQNDMPGAIKKLDEAIALAPGNPQLYKQRAAMHYQTQNKDAARKDLMTMVDIGQKSGDQNAAMEGQMMLQMLDQPAPTATPVAPGAAATPGASVPAPSAAGTPGASAPATPTAPATP